jgi:hypothetical protein
MLKVLNTLTDLSLQLRFDEALTNISKDDIIIVDGQRPVVSNYCGDYLMQFNIGRKPLPHSTVLI